MKSWKHAKNTLVNRMTQGARNWARRKTIRMGLAKRDWSTSYRRYESDKV